MEPVVLHYEREAGDAGWNEGRPSALNGLLGGAPMRMRLRRLWSATCGQ
jgi:hypothetical protein